MRLINRWHHYLIILLFFQWITISLAQNLPYPSKIVRIIVPVTAGGNVDLIARNTAQKLSEGLGQTFMVDNRPGGSSVIGSGFVAKAAPDGYTLMVAPAGTHTINPSLMKLPYDTIRDFAPISIIARGPLMLVAHPSLNVSTLQSLVKLAKSKPGQLSMASGGIGQLVGALFQSKTDTKFLDVPYQGVGPAGIALIGGQVDLMFDQLATGAPPAKAGKTRVLAVTSNSRTIQLPDVPTATEAGLTDFVVESITGVLAPAGTPSEIIDRLNNAILAALQQPAQRRRRRHIHDAGHRHRAPEHL
jgi:tripartite-type tricarboxylate transporter receptor subunit TctC